MDLATVIDDIYEASIVPERWHRVFDWMTEVSDAEGTMLWAAGGTGVRSISSHSIADIIQVWHREWAHRDGSAVRLGAIREARFLSDLDGFTRDELDHEPIYTEFLRPNGLGWIVGTAIRSPFGDPLVFSIQRAFSKGPVESHVAPLLDRVRPHLARAAMLSSRLGLERARTMVDALDVIGLPAAVLTARGNAIAANRGFDACAPAVTIGARDTTQFQNGAAQALFIDALGTIDNVSGHGTGRSIAVAGALDMPPFVAHLLPLRGASRDIFTGAAALLMMTPVTPQKAPDARLLEVLLDLTPAEARVANLIVEGSSVSSIAKSLHVSLHTIRTHLKSVFSKTGVRRQAELVSLLKIPTFGETAMDRDGMKSRSDEIFIPKV